MQDYIFSLLQHYGNPILFICLAAEYLGMPFVPGEAMMPFMGFAGLKGSGFAIFYSILWAAAGTFTGSMLAWLIGYRFGEKVVLKIGKPLHLTKEKLDQAKLSFDRHQAAFIIFSRFVPGVRHVVPYISGISRIKTGRYALLSLSGSVLWCGFFIGLGALFGNQWKVIVDLAKTYSLALLLLLAFVFVTMRFFKKHQKIIFSITFPLLVFIMISEDVINRELSAFDNDIYRFVAGFIGEDMTDFMTFLSYCGSGPVLVIITLVLIIAVHRSKKYAFYGWMAGANLVAGTILNTAFKMLFHRERPDILRLIDITGFSFPSGHSMIGLCFYGFLAYIFWANMKSRWRYLPAAAAAILIVSIGISRIYLGVHYASDVIGGFSAGLAWLAVFITVSSRIYRTYYEKLQVQV